MNTCEELFVKACKEIGLDLTENQLNQFQKYYELLIEWNEKINLTAITEKQEVYFKHFADCVFHCITETAKLYRTGTYCKIQASNEYTRKQDINPSNGVQRTRHKIIKPCHSLSPPLKQKKFSCRCFPEKKNTAG